MKGVTALDLLEDIVEAHGQGHSEGTGWKTKETQVRNGTFLQSGINSSPGPMGALPLSQGDGRQCKVTNGSSPTIMMENMSL